MQSAHGMITASSITEIVIYTPDHPGLFSQLAGAISVSMAPSSMPKFSPLPTALRWMFSGSRTALAGRSAMAARVDRLRQTIARTLSGEIKPREVLAKRPQGKRARRLPPRLTGALRQRGLHRLDCDRGRKHSTGSGLLYDITRALFEAGLCISSAMVATYGERAVDVFYVRDGFGHKWSMPAGSRNRISRLMKALEDNEALLARLRLCDKPRPLSQRARHERYRQSTGRSSSPACSRPTSCISAIIWAR